MLVLTLENPDFRVRISWYNFVMGYTSHAKIKCYFYAVFIKAIRSQFLLMLWKLYTPDGTCVHVKHMISFRCLIGITSRLQRIIQKRNIFSCIYAKILMSF